MPENGNVTTVQAMIFRKAGQGGTWIYPGPPRVITVRFTQRSSERGVCLNFGSQTTPDLAFLPFMNSPWACSSAAGGDPAFPDTAVTNGPVQLQLLNINSFDYGSFSLLEATAPGCVPLRRLPTGEVVEATKAETSVPKDDNANQIADAWVEDWYAVPNTLDNDDSPSNPFPGDGLTAYEEYRGFMMKGVHCRTFIDQKDLFYSNPLNFPTSKVQALSSIRVREVDPGEWEDPSRILNFNRGHAAGPEPQHLLKLTSGNAAAIFPGLAGRAVPAGGVRFGPPKNTEEIWVVLASHFVPLPGAPGMQIPDMNELADTVVHETGHALGAAHHAEGFVELSWILPPGSTAPAPDPAMPVFTHTAASLMGAIPLPEQLPAAAIPCTHSGCWTCIMRYRTSQALFFRGGALHAVYTGTDNQPFTEFCASPAGTGPNATGAAGPCAPGRGSCRDVLRVADRYPNNPP